MISMWWIVGTFSFHGWIEWSNGKQVFRVLSDVKPIESRGGRRILWNAARIEAFPTLRPETWQAWRGNRNWSLRKWWSACLNVLFLKLFFSSSSWLAFRLRPSSLVLLCRCQIGHAGERVKNVLLHTYLILRYSRWTTYEVFASFVRILTSLSE